MCASMVTSVTQLRFGCSLAVSARHTLNRRLTYTGHIANKTRVTYCFPEHFPCAFTTTHPDAQNVTDEPSIYLQGTKVEQF